MNSRPLQWSTYLAMGMVCMAFFYAGDAVGRMPYELADPDYPRWVPIVRVVVFSTVCWWAIDRLRVEIRRAGRPGSSDGRAAT